MSKRSLMAVCLLVFMTTSVRDAPAQGCQADPFRIHNVIVNKWGGNYEDPPDPQFVFDVLAPDLGRLGESGYKVDPQGDPRRDDDLVGYVYSVQKGRPAWRLHISTVGKYAVLQLQTGQEYSPPLVNPAGGMSGEIISLLEADGYRVLGRDTLKCPTSYRTLTKGRAVILRTEARKIRYWQMLFRIELTIP